MRFLVVECTGPSVAQWLRSEGHDVLDVYKEARGISDDEVLEIAYQQRRILLTNDKDFGEKIYREQQPHWGVVLFRLRDERPFNKIAVLNKLLKNYASALEGHFVVVTEEQVRIGEVVKY